MLGIEFDVNDNPTPPKGARWMLLYWDVVAFFRLKSEADTTKCKLKYHQQEDARVEQVQK